MNTPLTTRLVALAAALAVTMSTVMLIARYALPDAATALPV